MMDGIFETSSGGVKASLDLAKARIGQWSSIKRKSERRYQKVGRRVRLFARVSCFCGRSFRIWRFM